MKSRKTAAQRKLDQLVADNGGDGIDLAGCDGCVVVGNRIDRNGDTGIEVESLTGAWIVANSVTRNGDDGIDLQGTDADRNRIFANRTTHNADNGIVVDVGSTGNFLKENKAIGNAGLDLEDVNLPASPCPNLWRNNRFGTDNETRSGVGPRAGCIR